MELVVCYRYSGALFMPKRCMKYSWSCPSGHHGQSLDVPEVWVMGTSAHGFRGQRDLAVGLTSPRGHTFWFGFLCFQAGFKPDLSPDPIHYALMWLLCSPLKQLMLVHLNKEVRAPYCQDGNKQPGRCWEYCQPQYWRWCLHLRKTQPWSHQLSNRWFLNPAHHFHLS